METFSAMSQFAISYVTIGWFFTAHQPSPWNESCIPAGRPLYVAIRYHLGTLAFGSFLIGSTRVGLLILGTFLSAAHYSAAITECLSRACSTCVPSALMPALTFIVNKNAFMHVALRASGFCDAAESTAKVLGNATATVGLKGSTFVFQFLGLSVVASIGTAVAHFSVTRLDMFCRNTSPHFVHAPVTIDLVTGVVCCLMALPFVTVWDQVADTLLFCHATLEQGQSWPIREDQCPSVVWKLLTRCITAPLVEQRQYADELMSSQRERTLQRMEIGISEQHPDNSRESGLLNSKGASRGHFISLGDMRNMRRVVSTT